MDCTIQLLWVRTNCSHDPVWSGAWLTIIYECAKFRKYFISSSSQQYSMWIHSNRGIAWSGVQALFTCMFLFSQGKGRGSAGQPNSNSIGHSVSTTTTTATSSSTSSSLPPPVCTAGTTNGHVAPPTSSPNYPLRPQLPIPSTCRFSTTYVATNSI